MPCGTGKWGLPQAWQLLRSALVHAALQSARTFTILRKGCGVYNPASRTAAAPPGVFKAGSLAQFTRALGYLPPAERAEHMDRHH